MWANFRKISLFSISWAPANHDFSLNCQFFNFKRYLNSFSFQNGLILVFIILSLVTMKLNVKVPVCQNSKSITLVDRVSRNWKLPVSKFIWVRNYIDATFGCGFVRSHICVRKKPEKLAQSEVDDLEIWMIKYLKS